MRTKICFSVLIIAHLFLSCEDQNKGNIEGEKTKTGKVTFYNESSYKVKVHRDAFSGPVLLELLAGSDKRIDVRISDDHGYGTTFSIEYIYQIHDDFDIDSGEVFASGFDFNMQPNVIIEENKKYNIQIPNPANLEFKSSFIKLQNVTNIPVELKDYGRTLRQANGNIPIAPGKIGVYKLEDIPSEGELYYGYQVVETFESTPLPDFTVKNGFIYNFTYDGNSVERIGEQSIVFK